MIPGFVVSYKDNEEYVHLYFYPGIDNDNLPIYNPIDLSNCNFKYTYTKYDDNAVDYKFLNKNIIKLNCNLVEYKTNKYIYESIVI